MAATTERAARLHAESIVVDLLFQGPLGAEEYPDALAENIPSPGASAVMGLLEALHAPMLAAARGELPVFHEAWSASGVTAGNRQVELADWEVMIGTFGAAQAQFDGLPWLTKALVADDIRAAKSRGEHTGFVSTQLYSGPPPSLSVVERAHELGLRMLQLTYNTMNSIGAGCTERTDAGVSRFGAQLIALLDDLGVVVDTGHCGRQTTLDACELSRNPVIASHTAVQAVHPHARGKSDDELKALSATGGVIGVVTVPPFLSGERQVSISHMLDHIDYICELVGPEHAAIGTDWPMQLPRDQLAAIMREAVRVGGFRPEDDVERVDTLVDFTSYRDMPNVTKGLVDRGYSDEDVKAILGGNALRVFDAVWKT
jgi:membrane dipeptidase